MSWGKSDGSSFVRPLKEEIAQVSAALQHLQAGEFTAAIKSLTVLEARVGHAIRARLPLPRRHGQSLQRSAAGRVGWRHRDGGQVAGREATVIRSACVRGSVNAFGLLRTLRAGRVTGWARAPATGAAT